MAEGEPDQLDGLFRRLSLALVVRDVFGRRRVFLVGLAEGISTALHGGDALLPFGAAIAALLPRAAIDAQLRTTRQERETAP